VVLTHKPYLNAPYYITEVVLGSDDIGTAYKLVHADTGRTFKKLVPVETLKLYTADQRVELRSRLPLGDQQPQPQLSNSKAASGNSVR